MSDYVLFEEFHLSLHVPADLDAAAGEAIRRVLQSRRFRHSLRRAVRRALRPYPELTVVRVRISV